MTRSIAMSYRPVAGTGAGLGLTGGKALIADRPPGVAGGQGLGFNGGELLAAAIGGCIWNDLNYAADAAGVTLGIDSLEARVDLDGTPPRIVRGAVTVRLNGADEAGLQSVFDTACRNSTVAGSIRAAVPVTFERLANGETG